MQQPETIRNPQLDVLDGRKSEWNQPAIRRWGFHNLSQISRYGLSIRSPRVMVLEKDQDRRIDELPSVRRMTGAVQFSGLAVVRHSTLLHEDYAADFGSDQTHSIQSISKTTMHFAIGRLVDAGKIDTSKTVSHYIPEIGTGYAGATIQQVLDMDVINNFAEDYSGPYEHEAAVNGVMSYTRQEIALGWRLPPPGEDNVNIRPFSALLTSDDVANPTGNMEYRSANTDVLAWIAERVSGVSVRDMLIEIVEAAGIEENFFMSTDSTGVPIVSGGGALTARDLARYGQLFVRGGVGVNGAMVGGANFMKETLNGRGTVVDECPHGVRYSNQTFTNGHWYGHAGFAGQFLTAHPATGISVAYFSVVETEDAHDDEIFNDIMGMSQDIIALYE
ncbi:MAG: serine hydrolase [Rhodospirillales bacterium]|jgi:CubicO group peptidase (beta-lactamase class C family)|nr:serine hydrolase [Rhodospirillales bacterium]MBT4039475.1 serine hydrolase [Rhodospirillales bacterium]MBT4627113.1 serine hydrolase [Rhodospirillales bacterium]MBT5351147.1 serine hydrolase [Rhodospirillales bacterium]MBT5520457.1 serine hydrolase [Rhodospirillales bacterium]